VPTDNLLSFNETDFSMGKLFWLFMDSGQLWSAPAKRCGHIEPRDGGYQQRLLKT